MNAGWKIFLLAVATCAVAFGAERWLVPHVVPVGFADEPQSLWAVETAFLLRAVELIAAGLAAISLVVVLGAWARRRSGRGAH